MENVPSKKNTKKSIVEDCLYEYSIYLKYFFQYQKYHTRATDMYKLCKIYFMCTAICYLYVNVMCTNHEKKYIKNCEHVRSREKQLLM